MNILYLCDEYPPCSHGGIGSVTRILAREMVRTGHSVIVCGFYPYFRAALPYEEDQGVKVYRRHYGNKFLLTISKSNYFSEILNIEYQFKKYTDFLRKIIEDNFIDLIEIPDFNEAFRYSGGVNIKLPDFGIPTVIKLHGSYSFIARLSNLPIENKLFIKEKTLIHNATKVLAVSNFARNVSAEIFNYTKHIDIINNGVYLNHKNDYLGDLKSVIYAGKLSREKGILSLIASWEKVIEDTPSARLIIYGKKEKAYVKVINDLISDKTADSIELKGFVNRIELEEIYRMASCAVFPSYIETFGMAAMEAMSVGCPTIFTKRACGAELISNGMNGLLIDPDKKDEISNAIIYMLNNRAEAKIMGSNGAKTIQEKFNIALIAKQHINLYSELTMNRT